jgi:ADP-dependent NAD(P)H-hydrate dehydratase / NAD(P)H-hydrate epimerase
VKRALTAAQMRSVDAASAEHGMPGSVLMENAGEALCQVALKEAGQGGRFFVLCGLGNNGGDGLVVARKLAGLGRTVFVELTGNGTALQHEAARNFEALKACGITPAPIPPELGAGPGDVVVDALLGTGLSRAPEGRIADAIGRISAWRASGAKVIAADLPSGLDSDSGVPFSACVVADVTTTFGYAKLGQVIEPGASRSGRLEIVDIGIPRAAESVLAGAPGIFLLEESDVRGRIPKRRSDSHKGSYGHVLVVGGSWGKTGAAALAAMGVLRGGAGLVTVATRPEALIPVMQHSPEVMGIELVNEGALGPRDLNALLDAAEGKDAVVFGPGIERDEETFKLLGPFLEELTCPCVLDADGLNALAGHLELLQKAKSELLLTPHPGEMSRLLKLTTAEVQKNRVSLASAFAKDHQVVLVLKGARTLIARDDGTVFINPTGNPGMATGGTGDVLAGLCGALLAQGLSTEDAAVAGTWVHGLAGDLAKEQRGEMGLIASDLLSGLGEVWRRWGR